MSFGISVGDFIAVGGLIANIVSALKDSTGSKANYQELVRELETLDKALKMVDKLPAANSGTIDLIKCVALSCRIPLEQFMAKIEKYEPSLGPRSTLSTSKTVISKLKWPSKAHDIDRLQKYILVHLGTINILLQQYRLEQFGDIQESLRQLDLNNKATATAASIQHQATLVHASYRMVGTLFGIVSGELRSSLARVLRLTQSTPTLAQKTFDLIQQIQAPLTIDARWTYFQAPVKVEDALGRVFPVPSECDISALYALIRHRFQEGPGHREVKAGDFKLIDKRKKVIVDRSSMTQLLPGLDILMSIIVINTATGTKETCPVTQCASQNTVSVPWGGRTCCDCNRWFEEAPEAAGISKAPSRPADSRRKTRAREPDDGESSDNEGDTSAFESDDSSRQRIPKGMPKVRQSDLGYFKNITYLRPLLDADMAMRRRIRGIAERLDPSMEVITKFCILMLSPTHNASWVQFQRVLLSRRLRRSYIYEGRLHELGYTFERFSVWKTVYHLGEFAPISICPVHVTGGHSGFHDPFLVDFCVLPGSPPPGGVDFMLGEPALTTMYGPGWRPDWSDERYALSA